LQILYFPTATPNMNQTEYCWKTTMEKLASIKSLKNTKLLREELNEFWGEHTFTHKTPLFKMVTIDAKKSSNILFVACVK